MAPILTGFFLLGVLLTVPGLGVMLRRAEGRDLMEQWYLAGVISMLVASVGGLLLTFLGVFSLPRLLMVGIGFGAGAFLIERRNRARWSAVSSLSSLLAPILIAVVVVWVHGSGTECLEGQTDAGVYQMTGAQIAAHGAATIQDPFWGEVIPRYQFLFTLTRFERPEKFEGFFFEPEQRDVLRPQFFLLLPVWNAILYSLGGVGWSLHGNLLFALVGAAAMYRLAVTLAGRTLAVPATLLVVVNPTFIWFSRYPTGEMLMLALLMVGFDLERRGRASGDGLTVTVAGACLGLAIAMKMFGLFLLLPLGLRWLLEDEPRFRGYRRFYLGIVAGFSASVGQALWFSPDYLKIHATISQVRWIAAAGLVALVGAALVTWRFPPMPLRRSLAVLLVGAFGYGLWVRPVVPEIGNSNNLLELSWYLTMMGLLVGAAGLVAMLWSGRGTLLLPLAVASYTLVVAAGTGDIPFHIHAMRRFLPASIPGLVLAGFWLIARLGPARLPAAAVLAGVMGVAQLQTAAPWLSHQELGGYRGLLEELAGSLRPDDVVVVEPRARAMRAAAGLQFLHGQVRVLPVRLTNFQAWDRVRAVVARYAKRGRVLYLSVDPEAGTLPLVGEARGELAVLENTRNRPPEKVTPFVARLRLFDFSHPWRATRLRVWDLDVGTGKELGAVTGFFEARTRTDRHGRTRDFRWARHRAKARVMGEPQRVEVVLSGWRPQGGASPTVIARWNQKEIARWETTRHFGTYRANIPRALAGPSPGHRYGVLELETDPPLWPLRESPDSSDQRALGVMVDRIRFARMPAVSVGR